MCVWGGGGGIKSGFRKECRFSWLSKQLLFLAGLCMSSDISGGVLDTCDKSDI